SIPCSPIRLRTSLRASGSEVARCLLSTCAMKPPLKCEKPRAPRGARGHVASTARESNTRVRLILPRVREAERAELEAYRDILAAAPEGLPARARAAGTALAVRVPGGPV